MAATTTEVTTVRRRRSPWVWAALGLGGCLLLCIIACVALTVFGATLGPWLAERFGGSASASWNEAAGKVDLQLYEPEYVPPDSGAVQVITFSIGDTIKVALGTYEGGLRITQMNQQQSDAGGEPVTVEGADEARRTNGGLTLRKESTWITVEGVGQDEQVRVAESLRPVRAGP